jgi:D-alanyl-D-alanine carboxypeptidase (penicillin-binding protein 5/6)
MMLVAAIAAAIALGTASDAFARRTRHSTQPSVPAAGQNQLAGPYAAAALLEPTSGTFIFERNSHQPWPTASLAKMMVMLIVVEKLRDGSLKLTDRIATSRNASRMGGSQAYLKEGETFTLEEMMQAIVVHSANDASVAVAEHIAGSTDAFVRLMNRRAQQLGMKDTRYYSVHGLPPAPGVEQDVSSAYDCALLGRELIRFPDIVRWSGIDTTPFRAGQFELRNTNHLVRDYHGCDGLKTGFHAKAGFNVVATARRDGMRLIAVVLGSPHKRQNFREAAELLSMGFVDYQMKPIAKKGAEIAQSVEVAGGSMATIKPVYGEDVAVFDRRGDDRKSYRIAFKLPQSVLAPLSADQQIGIAEIMMGGNLVATVPLVAPSAVPSKPSLMQRLLGRR